MANGDTTPPPSDRATETPPQERWYKGWYKSPIFFTALFVTVPTLIVIAVLSENASLVESRFDSMDDQFIEVRSDLTDIREDLSEVAQRTSNIEGRLSVEALDEEEPETLAAETP